MLIEETTVPDGALPVEAFKAHLRLGSGFGTDSLQDEVLQSFLRAAVAAIEARTGKILFERAFRWTFRAWADPSATPFPVAPVCSVLDVSLVDKQGVQSFVDHEVYWLEQDASRPRLRSVGTALPVIPAAGSARVLFNAGMGEDWEALPADLRQAVMLLAAHYYEFRNDTGLSEGCMPFGVSSLIERYRIVRISNRVPL